jgi:broad specificity phosphatase PhoE
VSQTTTRLILVRHGQSLANSGGMTTDHIVNPLTPLGHQQAQSFADQFDCAPSLIVVSPFQRAQQTAEPLIRRFPNVPVEEWPIEEFTFLNPAHHRNSTEADRYPYSTAFWQRGDPNYIDGPGAESFSQFLDRARQAIRRLIARNPGGCVVLFTHGFFMQAFRLVLLFPNANDRLLMQNFLRFHLVNLIHNIDSLEFVIRDSRIDPVEQPALGDFTLQGESSHA